MLWRWHHTFGCLRPHHILLSGIRQRLLRVYAQVCALKGLVSLSALPAPASWHAQLTALEQYAHVLDNKALGKQNKAYAIDTRRDDKHTGSVACVPEAWCRLTHSKTRPDALLANQAPQARGVDFLAVVSAVV